MELGSFHSLLRQEMATLGGRVGSHYIQVYPGLEWMSERRSDGCDGVIIFAVMHGYDLFFCYRLSGKVKLGNLPTFHFQKLLTHFWIYSNYNLDKLGFWISLGISIFCTYNLSWRRVQFDIAVLGESKYLAMLQKKRSIL